MNAHQAAQDGQQTATGAGVASAPTVDAAAVLSRETLARRVALLEGLLRDLAAKGEAMKEAFFTGDDTREAIACMEWDDAVGAALADGG